MPAQPLQILVVESSPGAADDACGELTAAGHTVRRCRARDAEPFPCNGIAEGQKCPFDDGGVDVAIGVRQFPHAQTSSMEDGLRCAIRKRVPLVLAGANALSPYAGYATETIAGTRGVVATCERVAGAPLPAHTAAATRVAVDATRDAGLATVPQAVVRQRGNALVVEIFGAGGLSPAAKTVVSARVLVAVRELDDYHRVIDTVFYD
jgi:hypothetical protein